VTIIICVISLLKILLIKNIFIKNSMVIVLLFLVVSTHTQINIQKDAGLGISVLCDTPTCPTLLPNYKGKLPQLTASAPIYVPYNALGLVSANPLIITDYFTGQFLITNGTNGKDGKDGESCNRAIIWIVFVWFACLTIWLLILTYIHYKSRKIHS